MLVSIYLKNGSVVTTKMDNTISASKSMNTILNLITTKSKHDDFLRIENSEKSCVVAVKASEILAVCLDENSLEDELKEVYKKIDDDLGETTTDLEEFKTEFEMNEESLLNSEITNTPENNTNDNKESVKGEV